MNKYGPILDTKTFFAGLVKSNKADCILDIGSRDGDQSLFFRELAPHARVAAFEASPANYEMIVARRLDQRGIEVYPYAATNSNGIATFFVADPASDPHAYGSNSLLAGGYALKEKIEVQARRLDDFILEHYPDVQRIALWIDVESAEYEVLEGISKIKDRVVVIHTETAIEPVRDNQKTVSDVTALLKSLGFVFSASNLRFNIGDVVFLNETTRRRMGLSYTVCLWRALAYWYLPLGRTAVYLRRQFPPLYRVLRKIYIRFAT